jgi:hypothetical protein
MYHACLENRLSRAQKPFVAGGELGRPCSLGGSRFTLNLDLGSSLPAQASNHQSTLLIIGSYLFERLTRIHPFEFHFCAVLSSRLLIQTHPRHHHGRVRFPTQQQSTGYADDRLHRLNAAEQRELNSRMEKKQMKEFMTMYSRLVQRCFDDWSVNLTASELHPNEFVQRQRLHYKVSDLEGGGVSCPVSFKHKLAN